tara:strand:+ start:336 stop:575 length:240 start_codon:yes stop_codon:yes gene_type:complete
MNKQTTQEILSTYKNFTFDSIRLAIVDIEEQLTWSESKLFTPLYSKEEKKAVIEGLLLLEKVKYEEEQKEWFFHIQRKG